MLVALGFSVGGADRGPGVGLWDAKFQDKGLFVRRWESSAVVKSQAVLLGRDKPELLGR